VELQKGLDGLCPSRNHLGFVEKDNVLYIGGYRWVETGVEKAVAEAWLKTPRPLRPSSTSFSETTCPSLAG